MAFVAVLALGGALRLGHVFALRSTPWFENLVVDPDFYDRWAQRIAAGDWLGTRAFYMDPLYPYVLGLLYRLFGRDLLLVRLVQVAMSVGSCALVGRLGTVLGGRWIGLGAALGLAVYKPEITFTAEVEKTCLSVLLTAAALTCFVERTRASRLGAGVALGLGALTRANLLLLVPLGAIVLWRERDGGRRSAALFVAGVVLALAPVAWRNHHVSGDWVPTTTQGGQNFYMGNNPGNLSGSYGTLPFLRMNPEFEQEDFHAEAERRTGRTLDARATSHFWYGEALRFFRDDPATALGLVARKLALVWNDYEISDNQDQYLLARDSWVMRSPLPGFGLVAALAALGMAATIATSRDVRVLVGFVAVYSASVAAFFVFSRYRIQLVPALVPLAVLGVRELARATEARAGGRLVRDGAVVLAIGALAFHTIEPFRVDNPQIAAMRLHKLADVHRVARDPDGAIEALREAVAICPERCPGELDALVDLMVARGRTAGAIAVLREIVARRPFAARAAARLAELEVAPPAP